MTTSDKPAPMSAPVDHPQPWRVSNRGPAEPAEIRDANGQIVIYAPKHHSGLIAAAPEMLALLRHVAAEVLPHEYGRPDGKEGGIAEAAQEIIDRIDEARKAGG